VRVTVPVLEPIFKLTPRVNDSKPSLECSAMNHVGNIGLPNVGSTCYLNSLLKLFAARGDDLSILPPILPGEGNECFQRRVRLQQAVAAVLQKLRTTDEAYGTVPKAQLLAIIEAWDSLNDACEATAWKPLDLRASVYELGEPGYLERIEFGSLDQNDAGECLPLLCAALGWPAPVYIDMGVFDYDSNVSFGDVLASIDGGVPPVNELSIIVRDRDCLDFHHNGQPFVNRAVMQIPPVVSAQEQIWAPSAAVVHLGADGAGHYICVTRKPGERDWVLHDDSQVRLCAARDIDAIDRGARILHLTRVAHHEA